MMDLTSAALRARAIHPQVGSCSGDGCWGCEHLRSYFQAFADAIRDADLAFAREQLPTREAVIQVLLTEFGLDCRVCDPKWYGPIADFFLRDLRARLGGK